MTIIQPRPSNMGCKKLTIFLAYLVANAETRHSLTSRHCYFYSLKFFKNLDYRYYLLIIYTEFQLNTARVSKRFIEPVLYNSNCIVLHSYQPATIFSGILSLLVTVSSYSLQSRPSKLIDVFHF